MQPSPPTTATHPASHRPGDDDPAPHPLTTNGQGVEVRLLHLPRGQILRHLLRSDVVPRDAFARPVEPDEEAVAGQAGQPAVPPLVDRQGDDREAAVRSDVVDDAPSPALERPERRDPPFGRLRSREAVVVPDSPDQAVLEDLAVERIGLSGARAGSIGIKALGGVTAGNLSVDGDGPKSAGGNILIDARDDIDLTNISAAGFNRSVGGLVSIYSALGAVSLDNIAVSGEGDRSVIVEARLFDPASGWPWRPFARRAAPSGGAALEFRVPTGRKLALLSLSNRNLAPVGLRVEPLTPDDERHVELVLTDGTKVELRGLGSVDSDSQPAVLLTYDGILGEMLTATSAAWFDDGRWWVSHVAAHGADVEVRHATQRLRGRLPPATEGLRAIELR